MCSARRNGNKMVNPSNGVTCVTGRCTMVMCTQVYGARTKTRGIAPSFTGIMTRSLFTKTQNERL